MTPLPFLLPALLLPACTPCGLESSVPGFEPACDQAVLRRYTTEARLAVPGSQDALVAYLPRDVRAGERYGGTSGNPLTFLLGGQLASGRGSYLEFWTLDAETATGELLARFEDGEVRGDFVARVERGD